MKKVKQTDYLFLSANLRAREVNMLTAERISRMVAAPDAAEAARILTECGYPELRDTDDVSLELAIAARRQQLLEEIERLCPEKALVTCFRMRYDYHNAKVLIKSIGAEVDAERVFSPCGRVSVAQLMDAVYNDSPDGLPPAFARALYDSRMTLARTGNPRLSDIVLDRAHYAEILAAARELSSPFFGSYIRFCVDRCNLRALVRCQRAGMDYSAFAASLIEGGEISLGRFSEQNYSVEGVTRVFDFGLLKDAAKLGAAAVEGESLSPFDLACDNAGNTFLQRAQAVSFGQESVVAFFLSLEGEFTAVRMLMQCKKLGMSAAEIWGRMRESYV